MAVDGRAPTSLCCHSGRVRAASLPIALLLTVLSGCSSATEPSPTPPLVATPTATRTPATQTPSPMQRPTPSPSPTPTAEAAGTYLALGDSLAVGVGATRPEDLGYVGRLFASLSQPGAESRVTGLRNVAVSGETSTSMIRDGQLAAALVAIRAADPPVRLVTLDIGGNDLLGLLGTETCASAPQGPDCQQLLALTLVDFEANYRQIVDSLTATLADYAPDARLAVMTYFNPFSGTDAAYETAAELALLGTDNRLDCEADESSARGMNDAIACIGEEVGAIAVDVRPLFAELGLELTHIGSEDIHANDRGYEVIADGFLEALRQ
jgi:acyl-CoA thioesterase I